MKPLVSEDQARLTYLKRELARRVSRSKFFDSRCHYTAPKSKMPVGVKKLIKEIDELEKEIGGNGEVLRRQSKNYIPR